VLTSQKANDKAIISILTRGEPVENLLTKEWLLTNERGGYASSTIVGCNTRGYHGLLVGSLNPPANRIMALAKCLEMVISKGKVFNLSTFEFGEKFAPEGFTHLVQVRRDTGLHFDYELKKFELTKSIYLLRDTDTVALVYDFIRIEEPSEFVLRPFIGLRDFHTLQKSYAPLCSRWLGHSVLIRHDTPDSCELFLNCPAANFEKDEQWWFNFVYRNDKERGQEFTEDLWTPGFFKCRIDSPTRVVFLANLSPSRFACPTASSEANSGASQKRNRKGCEAEQFINIDIDAVREDLHRHQESVKHRAKSVKRKAKSQKRNTQYAMGDTQYEILCLAADQFIAKRQTNGVSEDTHRTTILAGFPWFADWGRDTFIALPGLLLSTGRFDEARSVLTSFAQAADEGMIPNRFDDRSDTAYFNSVDASLWFINAAFQYLNATGDSTTFTQYLLPVIRWIIDSYHNGTRFGICADADGLITAGNDQTQLTWMDAKYDGIAFTPRNGKAIEINALWYNSLRCLAEFYADGGLPFSKKSQNRVPRDMENAKHYKSMADKVEASFCELFWNEKCGYLNDRILPDGSVDETVRPNQIFAVSLPFSPLPLQHQKSVVDAVQKDLLTPYGLRTLNVQDSCYKGTYTGTRQQRDEAYHQGTVWPYLLGPFVEAYLKVNEFSRKSKRKAAEFIRPLMQHLTEDVCLGSASEIFDGDAPHKPRGCIAQAWSVAELIRAYRLING
jgi:glycogen debranching enzyme